MSEFTSSVIVNRPVQEVYAFLADMNNHRQLMPENIIGWTSTNDVASFEIQNITKLSLKIEERVSDESIRIIPAEKPPFDMELKWELAPATEGTQVVFTINAQLSMMMKMLASGQLQKLADEETQALARLLNN